MSLKSCISPCYNIFRSTNLLYLVTVNKNISRCLFKKINTTYIVQQKYASHEANAKKQTQGPIEIYNGPLTPHIKAVKLFSLSSSIIGIVGQPLLYKSVVSTGSLPIIIAGYTFIGFFTFVTPILLHFITKKYVTQLNYDEVKDTYIAKTVNFFCITEKTEFKVDDVKVPDVPGMFTSMHIKGKPLFMDPRTFEEPEHYRRIMGYDKPIDFKLYENSEEKK
ncbi:transmembrane protein 70 homolog, mitochondrial [Rhynchophorus ferrugineus]|uniref:transmembrane protein 70 homolog, mitochondrial n=1 Tax=Rhynchophorus ferrugineus TaxID=354439 RepID=UPI003FCEC8E6